MTGDRLRDAVAAFSGTARSPNLRRAQISFGAAFAADWMLTVGVGILAFRDGGAAAVGLVGLARLLPAAILAPVAAVVLDRFPRDRFLVVSGSVRSAALAGASLAVVASASTLVVYALAAVATVAHTLYRPAHSALLPSLCTTPLELTSANVVRGLLDSMSGLFGPLIAGALVVPTGVEGVLAAAAVSGLWSTWLIARLDFEAPPRLAAVTDRHPLRETLEGLAVMRRNRDASLLTFLACLQTITRGAFTVFAVVVPLEILRTGEAGVGVLTAGFGAGAVVGSIAASLLTGSSGFARWFGFGVMLWSVPFAALAGVSSQTLAVALIGMVGVANAVVDVSLFTLFQRLVPDEVLGRFFAAFEALVTLTCALGAATTPLLIDWLGLDGALIVIGALSPIGVLAVWRMLGRLDVRMHVEARVVALLQRVPMLRPLPMATIARLAGEASGQQVPAGEVVIAEGDGGDDFYVIGRGRATVTRAGRTVAELGEGDCFGEIAALAKRRRTSTVSAHTAMNLLRIRGEMFVAAVTNYTPTRSAATELVDARLESRPVTTSS